MSQQTPYFPLGGGLDLITPAIALKAGVAIGALNYEPYPNGYRRFEGFERFDGRSSPTDATFWMLAFETGAAAFAQGDTVTGASSGATGVVLAAGVVTSGDYGTGDAAGYVGLGGVTGTFVDGENLQVSGVTRAASDGTAEMSESPDDGTATLWQSQATANQRALILAIPGSGPVRGAWEFDGDIYGFRDNVGATAGAMWRASTAGWVEQALGFTVDFTSGGTFQPQVGETLTQGANSAVITNVVIQTGDWTTGDCVGYFTIAGMAAGAFAAGAVAIGANPDVCTLSGPAAAITLPAGGRYEFVNHNFYGASELKRMYGVNGVGRAFEWDGAVFTPIRTGMTVDTPTRLACHKKHLFLAFPGGSLQISETGKPLEWEVIEGAAELGMGDEITDLIPANAGVLTILAANSIGNLYGSSRDDFMLEIISDEAGALPWTADKVGTPIYMDKRGVRTIESTQAFGNFNLGTLTAKVKPLLQDYARSQVEPIAAVRVRNKDQYRLFFDNGVGLTVYLGKGLGKPEILPFNLGKVVRCICSIESATGEAIYFGSDDGYLYQMDRGYSFDGEPIPYSLRLPFNHQGAPQILKRYYKVVLECEAIPQATISVSADFDYGNPFEQGIAAVAAPTQAFTVSGGGGIWDVDSWNEFYWSSTTAGLAEAYLDGVGRNMSLLIAGETMDEPPHLLQGLTLFFTPRGLQR